MSDTTRLALLDDPQLRTFVPLLYVAARDGEIDGTERAAVHARLAAAPWLRPAARAAIEAWLDPSRPPADDELAALRSTLEAAAGTLSPETRSSLVALGTSLAGAAGSADAARAAHDLAVLLGLDDVTVHAAGLAPRVPEPSRTIDVIAMRRALDGAHATLRDRVRAFLDTPRQRAYGLPKDAYRALVRTWLENLRDSGLTRIAFPGVTTEEKDLSSFMVAFETLAFGDLSLLVKAGVQLGLFGGSIYFLGTERHRAMLDDVASLRLLGCFAMSEVGHGSNVADVETIARFDPSSGELVVHTPRESARKDWIGGAAHDARMATVFAQLEVNGARQGVHAMLVPLRDASGAPLPGVRLGDVGLKMGLDGVDNGRIWLDHVRIPRTNLLDRFASIDESGMYRSAIENPSRRFFTMLGTLVGGRISVGSAGVSVAKSALAIAIRYAEVRRQFGPPGEAELPLLRYPTHRRRLLPPLATTFVLHHAFEALRQRFVEVHRSPDADTRELEAEVAGLKAIASWHAIETVQACREACGGQGYLLVNRLPDLKADSDVFATFEGDNTVLLQLAGKSRLGAFAKHLSGGGALGTLRAMGEIAMSTVQNKNPFETRRTDRAHLRDRAFHLAALRHREDTLVRTAALRIRKRTAGGAAANDAMLEVQEHVVEAARAYVDRLVLEWFETRVAELADGETRTVLARLGDLHALSLLERRAAWFLEDGSFVPAKARAIRKEVEAALAELAPIARSLVDAFGIPDACLAAPIAFFDPAHPPA
jgi:acyl-CoA oxidase